MNPTNPPPQTVQESSQKQLEPRSLMLTLHVYDISSVQERLLFGAASLTDTAEPVSDTVPVTNRLNVLRSQIIDLDLIMEASERLRGRL
ncbi:hypothetical protein FLONG3_5469 [Fusarium longipes]|uniref:Uncharacterized protein n=1 Tax=Fusarium longipes TaxID=694270 RepID=A0A395SUB4_9HYPO|nr:hypothetical protein FLONG3_5469 [Fusarium longipes]